MRCKACGRLQYNGRFCENCGSLLWQQNAKAKTRILNRRELIPAIINAVLFGIIGLIVCLNADSSNIFLMFLMHLLGFFILPSEGAVLWKLKPAQERWITDRKSGIQRQEEGYK